MKRKIVCNFIMNIFILTFFISVCSYAAENKTLELTVENCIDKALTSNLNLKTSRLGLNLNEQSMIQEKSVFDPSLNFGVERGESKRANYEIYIPVNKIESETTNLNLSLNQKLATGAGWGAGLYNTLSESNIVKEKNFSSYFGVQINQPLWKGFGKDVNRAGIYITELSGKSTLYNIEDNATTLLYQTLNTYWNLVYAIETLHVMELSRAQADSLLAYNQKRLELGILTESDVLEAKSAQLSRVQDVLDQKNLIRETGDELKKILNITGEDDWDLHIIPTDKPEIPSIDLNIDDALRSALAYRPDYLSTLTTMKQDEIRLGVAKNSVKPDLNLNASYQVNSSGTTVNKDLRDLGEVNNYGWNIGVNLSYPIGNRSAKAALEKRKIDIRRTRLDMKSLENSILTEIRNSIGRVEVNKEKLAVATLSIEVNELKLRQEVERFRNHLSTSYLVLEYQKDLANARNLYNKALMDYTMAVIEFQRSKGTLLKDLRVNIISKGN